MDVDEPPKVQFTLTRTTVVAENASSSDVAAWDVGLFSAGDRWSIIEGVDKGQAEEALRRFIGAAQTALRALQSAP